MALSNRLGGFVLTAGNKSEMATGYATLYGADMTGAFAVIKDIPKMLVYALARDRNERAGRALIPEVVIDKPPSAELRPDQKDSDSLPEYAAARPDRRGLRAGRPVDRGAQPSRVSTPTPCSGWRVSSTATSTSAGRRLRECACRRRRSARIGVCPSPTAGPVRPSACRCATRRFAAEAALVLAALLYGITFPLVHDALEDITPFAYLVGRFGIAVLFVAPAAWISRARHAGSSPALARRGRRRPAPLRRVRDADRRPPVHVARPPPRS